MPQLISVTLKGGETLTAEFADETVETEIRFIERQRRARWGFPSIYWRTLDGKRWCFAGTDIVGELKLQPAEQPAIG